MLRWPLGFGEDGGEGMGKAGQHVEPVERIFFAENGRLTLAGEINIDGARIGMNDPDQPRSGGEVILAFSLH